MPKWQSLRAIKHSNKIGTRIIVQFLMDMFVLNFIMDIQQLVPLKDSVHIYSPKNHKLHCYTKSSILSACTVIQAVWQVSVMAVEHHSLCEPSLHAIIAWFSLSNMQFYCDLCTITQCQKGKKKYTFV